MLALLALAAAFAVPPVPNHYVTDNAAALSSATREAIEKELKAFENATHHQIIVWIGETTGGVPLETWTVDTANQWKIGHRGYDDGAVLFLFMTDHRIRIEVGYGLEGKLTDADAHRIIADDITPKMKAGDPDGAVSAGVADMLITIDPSYKLAGLPTPAPESSVNATTNAIVVVVFLIFFLGIGAFMAFVVISQIVGVIRYGYLVVREGPKAAQRDMSHWLFFGTAAAGSMAGGGDSFGGGGGDFDAGGGSFGGGGASGSW